MATLTVVSVTGINAEAHWRAIKRTQEAIPFPTRAKLIYRSGMDLNEYSRYVSKELHRDIETDFALICQPDGIGKRLAFWSGDFMEYSYCGAPFPNGEVGNGGLSLRSKVFLQESAKLPLPTVAEDSYLCQYSRRLLESRGMSFAPTEVGLRFSFEHPVDNHPWDPAMSWGSHGVWNL
jgi:hypothetical protein